MVMVDYPYATDFVAPLPAWPINYACDQAAAAREAHADDPLADLWATSAAAMVYLNYNNQLECIDVSPKPEPNEGLDDNGWSVQYCNEMAMPFASRESTSMFPPSEWNERQNSLFCKAAYGESPQYSWALDYFGGVNPEKDFMKASNIIFSNGELDPWHAGGVLTNVSDQTVTLYIENSAHHLDLRLPNPADPESLAIARQTETEWIAKWIDEYQGTDFYSQVTAKQYIQ